MKCGGGDGDGEQEVESKRVSDGSCQLDNEGWDKLLRFVVVASGWIASISLSIIQSNRFPIHRVLSSINPHYWPYNSTHAIIPFIIAYSELEYYSGAITLTYTDTSDGERQRLTDHKFYIKMQNLYCQLGL